ncbi:MAG TPA: hypothetical protein VKB22_03960 [Gemmatimonadales bacterium]|nr:hypothetical protein [Gemmatimonadales bacterium]
MNRLQKEAAVLRAQFNAAQTADDLERVRALVVAFRGRYTRTETLVDFYGDAVNARTNPDIAALLRACDEMAVRSMAQVLDPLGKTIPPVLTYVDKGLGASILKAGLRLWDGGTLSAVAAVKITFHNLFRPTALIHETGHQAAHITGWNEELAEALERSLPGAPRDVAEVWGSWASEIAADTFAFAHTGYAAVVSLCDVLSGDEATVFQLRPGDPHPIPYIRVLLGTEMCTRFFGAGPWDDLASTWTRSYPLENAAGHGTEALLRRSLPLLPRVVELCLRTPMRAFGGRPLISLLDPGRVKPEALAQLELRAGGGLHTSQHWIWSECLRLLALSGLRAATMPERAPEILKRQEDWMMRLGMAAKVA